MPRLAARFFGLCLLAAFAVADGPAAAEEPRELTIRDVLNHFPICLFPSSMGQRCKVVPDASRSTRTPMNQIAFVALTVEGDKARFTEEDWLYTFAVSDAENGERLIQFTDDGITGTYLVVEDFHVVWDDREASWAVIGTTLQYINDPYEAHRVGVFEPLSPVVHFVQ